MLKYIATKRHAVGIQRARRLRREMTLPEVLLRRFLRGQPEGVKFRRQHPVGGDVLDFFCSDARLAIEIDGIAHGMGNRPERDEARDRRLAGRGITTLQIPAVDILADPAEIAGCIVRLVAARLLLHHPASPDGPPSRDKLKDRW